MNEEQAHECAVRICSAYPHTAGKEAVINAYAIQMLPYPYRFVFETLVELPGKHDSAFCPTMPEIVDAMTGRFVEHFRDAVRLQAEAVYPTRYLEGDDEHRARFVEWYCDKVPVPNREMVVRCLRHDVPPIRYLQQVHTPLPPRDGGPLPPPERKDRDGRVCAAVRFGDWNGLLLAASGER